MKLVTIDAREVAGRPGVLLDSGDILDLTAAPVTLAESQWIPQSVVSILVAGDKGREHAMRLVRAAENATAAEESKMRDTGVLLPFSGTALMAPVRRPGLVLISAPAGNGAGEPDPVAFIKGPNTVVGPAALVRPPWNGKDQVVAMGMLAAVLGKPLYQASSAEAAAAVAAYTLIIDLSLLPPAATDLTVAEGWRRYIDSKQFPGACPMGPAMVTVDAMPPPEQVSASMRINDVLVSEDSVWPTADSAAELLAALSGRFGFRPGDTVALGPAGSTACSQGVALMAGDTFSVALDGIMSLSVEIAT